MIVEPLFGALFERLADSVCRGVDAMTGGHCGAIVRGTRSSAAAIPPLHQWRERLRTFTGHRRRESRGEPGEELLTVTGLGMTSLRAD